jgi:hypothetical protein
MEVSVFVKNKVRMHMCLILCAYRGRAVCVLCAIARKKNKNKKKKKKKKNINSDKNHATFAQELQNASRLPVNFSNIYYLCHFLVTNLSFKH